MKVAESVAIAVRLQPADQGGLGARSQRSPRSGRSRPCDQRANVQTVPSGRSRRGVFRSPHRTRDSLLRDRRDAVNGLVCGPWRGRGFGLIGECTLTSSSARALSLHRARAGAMHRGNLERGDRGPRRRQDGERPAPGSCRLERGVRDVSITGLGERGRPRRERARAHLLQADHVGLRGGRRRRPPAPAGAAPFPQRSSSPVARASMGERGFEPL